MNSPVIAKIVSMNSSFTITESKLGQFITQNTAPVLEHSIAWLAEETGISEPSINRFCNKLGYKGFNKLKIALAQDSFYSSVKLRFLENHNSPIFSVSQDFCYMIQSTAALLDDVSVDAFIKALEQVRTVHICSLGQTAFFAEEFAFKLSMAGIVAKANTNPMEIRLMGQSLSFEDILVIAAPSLSVKDFQMALQAAKNQKAKIAAFIAHDSSKLRDILDFKFLFNDCFAAQNSIALSDNLPLLFIGDVILCKLLQSNRSRLQRKMANDEILSSLQEYGSSLTEF